MALPPTLLVSNSGTPGANQKYALASGTDYNGNPYYVAASGNLWMRICGPYGPFYWGITPIAPASVSYGANGANLLYYQSGFIGSPTAVAANGPTTSSGAWSTQGGTAPPPLVTAPSTVAAPRRARVISY